MGAVRGIAQLACRARSVTALRSNTAFMADQLIGQLYCPTSCALDSNVTDNCSNLGIWCQLIHQFLDHDLLDILGP